MMKTNKTLFTFIFLFVFLGFAGYAQKNSHLQRADSNFYTLKYSEALLFYKKAYAKANKDKKLKAEIMYKIALTYRKQNDYKNAASWFLRAVKYNYPDKLAQYYYAEALKINGDYEQAINEFKKYQTMVPEDSTIAQQIESCDLALKWLENTTRYQIDNKETRRLNSKQSDFSPFYADSKYRTLIFTSSREGAKGKATDEWTGESFQDLFFTQKDRLGRWKTPIPFADVINTEANEGSASLNKRGTTIYFTRCKKEKKSVMGCQIYMAQKSGKEWQEAKIMAITDDTTDILGHPAVNADESELYFAAEMVGGYGGKDIYVVSIQGSSIGEPQNLGNAINTAGDELFPFVGADGTLYFASNGHFGMGGLDVYKSIKIDNKWTKPENMKAPINSSFDDFGIVFEESGEFGFLSSNRPGGRGKDDIWEIILPPLIFTLQGTVIEDSTQKPISNADVKISGSDGSTFIVRTDDLGKYKFNEMQILPNTTYDLLASQKGYFAEKAKETTVGLERNADLEHDFILRRIPTSAIELPEILYDFAKWDLKPQYQDSLNGLIETMNNNPFIVIELASHTDSRSSLEYNDTLSQKRAQSVVDYLIEKGIPGDRMKARGYGERVPKVLSEDIVYEGFELKQGTFIKNDTIIAGVSLKKGLLYEDIAVDTIVFAKGAILNEQYIESLPSVRHKELAHQLNRRTEFRVIGQNYVPKTETPLNKTEIEMIRPE